MFDPEIIAEGESMRTCQQVSHRNFLISTVLTRCSKSFGYPIFQLLFDNFFFEAKVAVAFFAIH